MEQISKRLMNWATILEDNTREQAVTASTMPFIHPHIALMPDAHLGKGATVGSVIPTLGAIMPAAVGVDIGCGMMAVETGLHADDLPDDKSALHAAISAAVPLSAGKYNVRPTPTAPSPAWPSSRVGRLRPGRSHRPQLADAARVARIRQPLHRGQPGRGRRRLAVPPLGLARRRQQARDEAHQGRPGAVREALHQPPRPRPGLPRRGRAGVLVVHGGAPLGPAVRLPEPRGDDGAGRRLLRGVESGSGSSGRERRSTATTTTPSASGTSARTSGCPARALSTPAQGCAA